jgi:Flp pilus assembly protein TadD
VPYSWDLTARDFPPQRGQFALLSPAEVAETREGLAALGQQGYPKNTAALLRAGFLFERELYAEAQKELQAATSADPDEPDLHVMLGQIYERLSLQELAAQEYDEAQFLISAPPARTP